jgi:Ala-tRNA(Pro) deacylase
MTVAGRLKTYLEGHRVPYDLRSHPRSESSSRTAQAAHVPGDHVAKSVVVRLADGHAVAVVPSTHRLALETVENALGGPATLASEDEVTRLFEDCDVGAVPPIGAAYGLPVLLDESLDGADEVYFEGGDHTTLVRVSGDGFRELMKDARRGVFSQRA